MATFNFDATRWRNVAGNKVRVTFDFTPGSSVSAGGETVQGQDIGLGTIEDWPPMILNDGGTNIIWAYYDYTNEKVVYFDAKNNEVTGDLSSYSTRVTVEGAA